MKKISMLFLGVAIAILVTGCGNKENELICTNIQTEDGMKIEQTISMIFKNDKIKICKNGC